jgi:hypothetical protein
MEILGVKSKRFMVRGLMASLMTMLALVVLGSWLSPVTPALGQGPAALMEKPALPEEKKEETPSTTGPMITDTAVPIDTGKLAMQLMLANEFVTGNFSNSWRHTSAKGNFYNFYTKSI